MKNYKSGFTLAEVLITLVIIGVVAALTIPTALNNIEQRHLIIGWRKAYSEVSRALLLAKANGENFDDGRVLARLPKYMNMKNCGADANYDIYRLNGQLWWRNMYSSSCRVIESGMYITIDYNLAMVVDVNGSKKPNTIGKDVFFALIDRDNFKLNPAIGFNDSKGCADGVLRIQDRGNGTCQTADDGYGCSAWYLLHDK